LDAFGMSGDTWDRIAAEADVILHNGALVCVIILRLTR
jgi:thioester reductase-like protein